MKKKDMEICQTILMSLYPEIFLHRGIHENVDIHDKNVKSYLNKTKIT